MVSALSPGELCVHVEETDLLLPAAASCGNVRHGGHQSQAPPEPLHWLTLPTGWAEQKPRNSWAEIKTV